MSSEVKSVVLSREEGFFEYKMAVDGALDRLVLLHSGELQLPVPRYLHCCCRSIWEGGFERGAGEVSQGEEHFGRRLGRGNCTFGHWR